MNVTITKSQFFVWIIQFLLWFLPLLAMVNYIYFIEVKSFRQSLSSEEILSVHVGKEVIIKDLEAISTDVQMIAKQTEFYELPLIPKQSDFTGLQREFLNLSQMKQHYDQVRYIDNNGQETIRVNFNNGNPTLVPTEALQNKSTRYYFKEAFVLQEGEIFVSPFDLNIEQGRIEKPFKPMLRFATPVFDKNGTKRGIVILNYLGSKLIDDFKVTALFSSTDNMLLNNESFWLYSTDSSQEWGFMLGNEHRFDNLYPKTWKRIDETDTGQVLNEEGMFTFDTVYPLSDGMISSSGVHKHSHMYEQLRNDKEYYWKIVSHISDNQIVSDANDIKNRLSYIFLPIFLLLLLAHLLIAYVRFQQKHKEQLLNEIMQHSLNEIYILDAESFLFTQVNYSALNNIGYSMNELKAMTPLDLVPSYTVEKFEELVEPLKTGKRQILVFEVSHQRKDGTEYPTEVHLKIMKGKKSLFVAVVVDISERRKRDEKINQFAHMVSNTSDMMALVDSNYVYQSVNEAYMRVTTLAIENIIGHTISDVLGKDFFNSTCKPNAEQCFKGKTISFENRLDFPEQKNRLLSVVYSPYYDAEDVIQGFIISSRDITEYEHLRASKLESIGILAGGIAHNFNNILTGLFGNIYLAKMKLEESNPAIKYLDLSELSLERARALTNQLLTFSQGGTPVLEIEDITNILQDSIKLNFSGSSVKPILNLPDDLWLAKVDRAQLSQAFSAILLNAIQSMKGGGNVHITGENIHNIDNSTLPNILGDVICIHIRDEGIGISEKEQGKIFDLYFSTKHSGSGIGLSSAQSIIQKHGGIITVDSTEGSGSRFTICIPTSNIIQKPFSKNTSKNRESTTIPGHILLMDDEQVILEMTKEMLESFGHTVEVSENGTEALEKYKSAQDQGNAFDIVIMDLTIPGGMGGSEAVKKLLEIDTDAKVIVSSGYSTDAAMADFEAHGFKARLLKPFQMQELQQVLSSLLEQ